MGIGHFPGTWGEPLAIKLENLARTVKYPPAHAGAAQGHTGGAEAVPEGEDLPCRRGGSREDLPHPPVRPEPVQRRLPDNDRGEGIEETAGRPCPGRGAARPPRGRGLGCHGPTAVPRAAPGGVFRGRFGDYRGRRPHASGYAPSALRVD